MNVEVDEQGWDLETRGLEKGPSVVASITIEKPAETVWAAISARGYLKNMHPFCAETKILEWPGERARDTITYFSGLHFERRFIKWFDGVGYDLELGVPARTSARVRWRLEPVDKEACKFSIEVFSLLKIGMPPEKKATYLAQYFGADMQHYLECVVKGCEYWCRTGEPVREDQFGRNPIYSAP